MDHHDVLTPAGQGSVSQSRFSENSESVNNEMRETLS